MLTRSLAAAALCLTPLSMQAGTLNLLVSNVDVEFDSTLGELLDQGTPAIGSLAPADADAVTSIEYELDGAPAATQTSPPDALYVDLSIASLGPALSNAIFTTGAGSDGLLDLFTADGELLRLGIEDISYVVIPSAIPGANLFQFSAEATVLSQDLPAGLAFDGNEVLISYTATDATLVPFVGGPGSSALTASGQLTITGSGVPEPGSMALLALGGLMVARRRRA